MADQRIPVGVRFKEAGKVYYFDSGRMELHIGDRVVVETSHGKEIAQVVLAPDQVIASEIKESLKPIVRLATEEDLESSKGLRDKAREGLVKARIVANEQGSPIRIVSAGYDLDGSGVTLYYSAEERGDLRSLPRELASALGAKVQLLQVGERDRAKITDGFGRCGERLCCASWLSSFPSVSIKMAKEQELPLNPVKISGVCGRLLCCLTYEYDNYKAVRSTLPKVGSRVSTPDGEAKITSINVPRETVSLFVLSTLTMTEVPIAEFLGLSKAPRPAEAEVAPEAPAQPEPVRTPPPPARGSGGRPSEAAAETPAGDPAKKRRRRRGRRGGRRTNRDGGESGGGPDKSA